MTDSHPHTILNVDDNEPGRYAKTRILQRAGYDVLQAGTGAEALRVVKELRPQLVLLDVKLPDISGLEVCREIKNSRSSAETMILQISASRVSPADRVQGLEIGADAYLTEPIEPQELLATTRALLRLYDRERENRQLLAELVESEAQFRASFEVTSAGMCQADPFTGRLFRVNQRLCEMLGYDEAELVGRAFSDFTHPEERAQNFADFLRLARGEVTDYRVEKRYIRKNGEILWTDVTVNLVHDANGEPLHTLAVVLDITQRKQTEQERSRLAAIVDSSEDAIIGADLNGNITSWNRGAAKLYGYSAAEIIGQPVSTLIPADDHKELAILERVAQGEAIEDYDTVRHRKDGTPVNVSLTISPIRDDQGKIIGASKIARDISERRLSELTRAWLASMVEHTITAIIGLSPAGIIESWNPAAARLFGYTPGEAVGQSVGLLWPNGRSEQPAVILAQLHAGEPHTLETVCRGKGGQLLDVILTVAPVFDEAGSLVGVSASVTDVTARKLAEQALWRSEEQLSLAQDAAHVGIWDWDPRTGNLAWTAEMLNLYGVASPPENYTQWRQLVHVDDIARVEAERDAALQRRRAFDIEYRVMHGSGEVRWIALKGEGYYGDDGELTRVLAINMDVNERKRAEEERVKFEALVESSMDYIGMADPGGHYFYLNPAGRALIGVGSAAQMMQRTAVDFVADESKALFHDTVLPELIAKGVWQGELALKHQKSGEPIDVYSTFFMVKDPANGKPMCIANVARDTRERKRAEEQLRESEERFKTLADSAPVLICISGPEGAQFCNQAYRDFVGVESDAELIGLGWTRYLHPDDRDEHVAAFLQAVQQLAQFEADFRLRRADGQYRWMKTVAKPRFVDRGTFIGYAACTLEIHERKIAEAQLALLAAVVNSSQDAIYSFTLDGRVLSWNGAAETLFGWTEAEMLGRPAILFTPPELITEWQRLIEMVRRGESVSQFETVCVRKDGGHFDALLTFSPVTAQGKIVGISAITRDITERKRAQEQRDQQARLLDLSLDAIIVSSSADGAIQYWNEGAEKLYGYSVEEAIGCPIDELLKTTYPVPRLDVEKQIHDIGEWDGRLVHVPKRGGRLPVLSRMQRIIRLDGDVILEVNRDITIIEEAERAVVEAAAHLKAIVETAVDGIITIDEHGAIESVNPAAEKIFGYAAADMVGMEIGLVMPDLARISDEGLVQYLRTGERQMIGSGAAMRGRRRDGSEFPLDFGFSETVLGERRFFTGLVRDASARKKAEQSLIDAKNAADAANRAKSEFLANMSHEIRNPMTGVMGYADILLGRLQDAKDIEYVRTIKDSGQYLLQIVNDLLDLAKIESQGLELEKEEINLPTFLTDVYTLMEGAARAKSLPLVLKYEGMIPQKIESDSKRLRQILINLLSNAVKFTHQGGAELTVCYNAERGELELKVSDTGIGMTEGQQQNLFKPFTQGDSSVTKAYGGTGLGLAITKRLVEALGGRIGVTSRSGQGSTFTVTLPVRVLAGSAYRSMETEAEISVLPGQQTLGARVMIVEDQPDIRRLMEYFIADAGARVTSCDSGEAVLDAVEQSPDDFDVILMDIQMPYLDGYETTRRLRGLGFTKPIIAVTAGAMAGDEANCLAAGCSDYISKPIDREKLLEIITRAVARRRAVAGPVWSCQAMPLPNSNLDGQPVAAESAPNNRGKCQRVLIVDDRPVALNATTSLLELHGFEVRAAATGHGAIRAAADFRPDYVFLDLSLPDISGYEVFRRLKSNELLANTRFIALSGHGPEEHLRAQKAGFDAYFTKPVDIKEMEKLIAETPPAGETG
jgi:PAS domain S-box-containing protein